MAAQLIDAWPAPGRGGARKACRAALRLLRRLGDDATTRRFLREVATPHYGSVDNDELLATAASADPATLDAWLPEFVAANVPRQPEAALDLLWRLCERERSPADGEAPRRSALEDAARAAGAAFPAAVAAAAAGAPAARRGNARPLSARAIRSLLLVTWRCGLAKEAEAVARLLVERPAAAPPQRALPKALAETAEVCGMAGGATEPAGFATLWRQAASSLLARSAQPPEQPADWVMAARIPCSCPHCRRLQAFCDDPAATTLRLPLRKELRRHVHGVIDGLGLDIRHQTERKGRPYTLVCTKTRGAWKRRCAQYAEDIAHLRLLAAAAPSSGAAAARLRRRPAASAGRDSTQRRRGAGAIAGREFSAPSTTEPGSGWAAFHPAENGAGEADRHPRDAMRHRTSGWRSAIIAGVKLEDLQATATVRGILSDALVTVVSTRWFGSDALKLTCRGASGELGSEILYRDDEARLEMVEQGRPWSFDGDGELFRLVSEALRIHLAHLFDPTLAVHTSLLEPLPHQITAVYEAMLPRQPLRFLPADDPGAGKTIMTGLLMKELIARGDLQRCLASSPEAIYQSLRRRRERLQSRLRELDLLSRGGKTTPRHALARVDLDADELEDLEDLSADEQEETAEEILDQATAARSVAELKAEISTLRHMEEIARGVRHRRLLEKLEQARESLGGQVFDVLGKLQFAGRPLRDLLLEAIRYGEQPEVRARLTTRSTERSWRTCWRIRPWRPTQWTQRACSGCGKSWSGRPPAVCSLTTSSRYSARHFLTSAARCGSVNHGATRSPTYQARFAAVIA